MPRLSRSLLVGAATSWLFLALAGSVASVARADGPPPDRSACIAGSLNGQRLRVAGHWTAARDAFAVCANSACPAIIRTDCAKWSDELLASTPTVVLGVQDADGHDVTDATLTLDGNAVSVPGPGAAPGPGAGQAVPVDPGSHHARFQRPDGTAVEQDFTVRDGEKRTPVILKLAPQASRSLRNGNLAPDAAGGSSGPNMTVGLVVGLAGVAFVGVGAYFFAQQSSDTNAVEAMCAGGACRVGTPAAANLASQVSTVNTDRALAGTSFAVGGVAVAVGAYFLIARPLGRGAQADVAPKALGGLELAPARGGGVVGYHLSF